jgi:hypothetical protein
MCSLTLVGAFMAVGVMGVMLVHAMILASITACLDIYKTTLVTLCSFAGDKWLKLARVPIDAHLWQLDVGSSPA